MLGEGLRIAMLPILPSASSVVNSPDDLLSTIGSRPKPRAFATSSETDCLGAAPIHRLVAFRRRGQRPTQAHHGLGRSCRSHPAIPPDKLESDTSNPSLAPPKGPRVQLFSRKCCRDRRELDLSRRDEPDKFRGEVATFGCSPRRVENSCGSLGFRAAR